MEQVALQQFDGQGRRVFLEVSDLIGEEHTRLRVGQVAVPFGICTEPTNVKAGGHACPYKYTCVGCGHFRSDASYLPELKSYLQQLLADRERIMAATDIQDWAKAKTAPATQEITQLRDLIHRIEHELGELDVNDQERIREAIDVVRNARQIGFAPDPTCSVQKRYVMTTATTENALTAARRRDVQNRRGRVQLALQDMQRDGAEITLSAVARRAKVHRSFLHRHTDLRAEILAAAEQPAALPAAGAVTRRTLDADNLNLRETVRRQSQHIADLETRLSELLGDQAYARSGLGAPRDHATLEEQILTLQAEVNQLRGALTERGEELDAARQAHRQLMSQLNRPHE